MSQRVPINRSNRINQPIKLYTVGLYIKIKHYYIVNIDLWITKSPPLLSCLIPSRSFPHPLPPSPPHQCLRNASSRRIFNNTDSPNRGRTTMPWGLSTTTTRGASRGSTRLSRGRSGSRRRADSPRHPPPPRASSRGSVGSTGRGRALGSATTRLGRSASRGSSRGSSPASSR